MVLLYIEEVVVEREALGLGLQLPYHIVKEIKMDQLNMESKRKELIRRWINSPEQCGPACWWLLIKVLEDKTVKMNSLADKIKSELGMPTSLKINIMAIQLRQLVTVICLSHSFFR